MLPTMTVKIVNDKVVEASCTAERIAKQEKPSYLNTNDKKIKHIIDIGVDLTKYHPATIKSLVGGGRQKYLPDNLKKQLLPFAIECSQKNFTESHFGYGTKLGNLIRSVNGQPEKVKSKKKIVKSVLDIIEKFVEEERFDEANHFLEQNKLAIDSDIYQEIKKSIS